MLSDSRNSISQLFRPFTFIFKMFSLFMKSGRMCKKKNQRQSFGCCLSQVTKWILNKLRSTFCAFWRCRFKNMKGKSVKKGRDWILEKKERRRRQGRYVYNCDSLAKLLIIFLKFLILAVLCNICWHLLSLSAVCLWVCRDVRADTKYTGRQRKPRF